MEKIIKEIRNYTGPQTCKEFGKIAEVDVSTEKGNAYERAVAHKDIIRAIFTGEAELSELSDLVDQGIESMYALDETNEAMRKKEETNLYRYLSQEKRKPIYVGKEAVDIGYENIHIVSKPDVVFIDRDNKMVEAVTYRSGMPTINQRTGIKPEKIDNLKEWFKLWVNLKYAKAYAENNFPLKDGDVYVVKSSYYFMKKNNDTTKRDNDFFSGNGGNIVFLEDKYCYGAPTTPTDDDIIFRKFIDQCDSGLDCTEEDCKRCIGKSHCKYTKAPLKLQEKKAKKRAKITPSESQQKIIDAVKGIYKVNATAGSGKTECMTERVKRLYASGVSPSEILLISFTDAAVGEMKTRIEGKCLEEDIPVTKDDIQCYTFNGFANKAIGEFYAELGFSKAPRILSAEYELNTIEKILAENPLPGMDVSSIQFQSSGIAIEDSILTAQKAFDIIKTKRIDLSDVDAKDTFTDYLREKGLYRKMKDVTVLELMRLYEKYDKILKEDNFVTYADQEPLMFKVLELHPEYFANLGFKHIVVDEFQDSNEIQLETIKMLKNTPSFESLMVVGDDSQAIYAFRDTTPEYIINFEKYIEAPVTDLFLTENRRSTPEVIALSNAINNLNQNKVDKDMVATRESGKKPIVKGFYSKQEELAYIQESIVKKITEDGVAPEAIAFIAAKKTELQEMGSLLTKAGIPWVMKNPMDLMENSRVIGALSIADAFYQPEATALYFNYLCAKYDGELLNKFTAAEINTMIADMRAEFEVIYLREMEEQRQIFHRYLDEIKKSTEDELYDYFLSLVYDNEDLQSELEYTRIFKRYGSKMTKKMDQNYSGVVLTTAHSSKGLEWPVCYVSISNFDSERLHKKGVKYDAEREEKRRLIFVSTTRARDELVITGKYVAYGPKDDRTFNQFLRELYQVNGQEKEYQPIDPMEAIRDAERKAASRQRAKERAAEKAMEKKLQNISHFPTSGRTRSKEMSAEDRRKYDKMAAGAEQIVLPF